jgi:hypothetical protein
MCLARTDFHAPLVFICYHIIIWAQLSSITVDAYVANWANVGLI